MYKPYRNWLSYYLCCLISYKEEVNNVNKTFFTAKFYSEKANAIRPPFMTKEFCNQHKRRLFTKSQHLYQKFSDYGISNENWYFVNNQLIKYKNGKKIK